MYLLDTSVILWALKYPDRLGAKTTKIIYSENLYISVVSLWEIIIKVQKGKLKAPLPASGVIELLGASELSVNVKHVDEVTEIKLPHKDPFDKLLLAQARVEGFTLLTTDLKILESSYPVFSAKT